LQVSFGKLLLNAVILSPDLHLLVQ